MAFARTETTVLNHPKFVGTDPAALGLWMLGNAYCWDQLTDGFISDEALPRLLSWCPPKRVRVLANVLANATARGRYKAGLWERVEGGFLVHDWLKHNPTKEAIIAERDAAKLRMKQRRASQRSPERTGERAPEQSPRSPERAPVRSRQDVDVDVDSPPIVPHANGQPPDPKPRCTDGRTPTGQTDWSRAWRNTHPQHLHSNTCAMPANHAGYDQTTGRYRPMPAPATQEVRPAW